MGQAVNLFANYTDDSTCTINYTFIEPSACNCSAPGYNFNLISINGESCIFSCDGEVQAFVTGGVPPYSYLWNDPFSQTTAIASNLCIGNYSVQVIDAQGCNLFGNAIVDTISTGNNYSISDTQFISSGGSVPICVNDTAGVIQSYFWSTGEQSQCILVSPVQTTYYTVQISFCSGTVTDSVLVVVDSSVSIAENLTELITTTYPNPVKDILNISIESKSNQMLDIVLYDIMGRELLTKKLLLNIGNNIYELNILEINLSDGIYYIKLNGSDYSLTHSFIVD